MYKMYVDFGKKLGEDSDLVFKQNVFFFSKSLETKRFFHAMLTRWELIHNWLLTSIDGYKLARWRVILNCSSFKMLVMNYCQKIIEIVRFDDEKKCQWTRKIIFQIFALKYLRISAHFVKISIKSVYQKRVSWVYLAVVCVGFVSSFELLYRQKCRISMCWCVRWVYACDWCDGVEAKPSGFSSYLHVYGV